MRDFIKRGPLGYINFKQVNTRAVEKFLYFQSYITFEKGKFLNFWKIPKSSVAKDAGFYKMDAYEVKENKELKENLYIHRVALNFQLQKRGMSI